MTTTSAKTLNILERVEQAGAARRQLRPRVQIHRSASAANGTHGRRRSPSTNEKHTVDQVMIFEQYTEDHPAVRSGQRAADDMIVLLLKGEINAANITRRDLYNFVGSGPGMLFKNRNQAYNLEYGLRDRSMISIDCAQRWLSVIGKELVIQFRTRDADQEES